MKRQVGWRVAGTPTADELGHGPGFLQSAREQFDTPMRDRWRRPAIVARAWHRPRRSAGRGTCPGLTRRCRGNADRRSPPTQPTATIEFRRSADESLPPRVCTAGAAGSVDGSSSKAGSARTSKRRSCPAAVLAFMRTSKRTQPCSIFSQSNCSTLMAAARPPGRHPPIGGEAIAGAQFDGPARLRLPPSGLHPRRRGTRPAGRLPAR